MKIIKPRLIKENDCIGVFTSASSSYDINEGLYLNGLKNLRDMGFQIKEGFLTKARASEGYRAANAKLRAQEFMELIEDDEVHALVATIGGMNSNSLIPYLDFEKIRKSRKIICGYSDITALHMAILHYSGLSTLYGPAVMTWFGDYPNGVQESTDSFLRATSSTKKSFELKAFCRWSNHARDWTNGDWKKVDRIWKKNDGWKSLNPGKVRAPIVVANLNTLISCAGTEYFPELEGCLLLIEEMGGSHSNEERNYRQLQLMGVFDKIKGLIIGKVEFPDNEGARFSLDDLLLEVIGHRSYPIVTEFDCSHTLPMHSIGQHQQVELNCAPDCVEFKLLDSFVESF